MCPVYASLLTTENIVFKLSYTPLPKGYPTISAKVKKCLFRTHLQISVSLEVFYNKVVLKTAEILFLFSHSPRKVPILLPGTTSLFLASNRM